MTSPAHADPMQGLGANERAVLDKIPWAPARRGAARIVHLKMRLQFTGWLQYLLPAPLVLGFSLLGALAFVLAGPRLAAVFLVPAAALTALGTFDIVTTKWKIRPAERRPSSREDLEPFDLILARRSCRSFQTRPMADADRQALLSTVERELARPTIGAIEPRLEYICAPLTVWPTVNASEFLVAVVPKPYNRTAIIDVGRTLQRIVINLTRLGLATCWIGPGADQRSIATHLGPRFDAQADHIICVCAVGYPSRYVPLFIRLFNRAMSTRRLPLNGLFFSDDALEHPIDTTAAPYDCFGRTYEACRWAPSSYNGQTTRAVVETGEDASVAAVKFLAVTASRYYAPVALGIWCANWELGCEALGLRGVFERGVEGEGEPRWDVAWRVARE